MDDQPPGARDAHGGPPGIDPNIPGPLDRATALGVLRRADELLEAGEHQAAGIHYQRVIGFDDAAITASAYYGLGNALYRMDREDDAVSVWQRILELPETPATYLAWRQIAAARVRGGDLPGAIRAYREADRRAPPQDKAEIASRLGWLAKETGDTRGAARQFRRSRGSVQPVLTWLIIAVTVVVSFTAYAGATFPIVRDADFGQLYPLLWLDKPDIANGELWRLVTVALLHAPDQTEFFLHLGFNMYALYIVGPVVESMYGVPRMLLMYVATAITASVSSFVFGPAELVGVGASGAIFGLFGVLFISSRVHHPILAGQQRAVMSRVGTFVILNLALGFAVPGIDNAAHIGGLLGGLWLGLLFLPSGAPTLAAFWQTPDGRAIGWRPTPVTQVIGVAILVAVVGTGLVVGDDLVRRGADIARPALAAIVHHRGLSG